MPKQHQIPAPHRSNYGWLSGCLRWPSLLAFSILDIALAATIIALTIVSSANHGFVTIPPHDDTPTGQHASHTDDISISWDLGVLWTSLPSFVFALFGAYWAWIAGSIAERQPYVELRKENGAEARLSVLLDYRVTASVWRWWGAFRKSHYTVGSTTLLSVLLTYAVAPFAARLFVPDIVMVSKALPVVYNATFDDQNINSTLDWRPVLDTVAATLLYHGNSIAWTDEERAFRPFFADSSVAAGTEIASNTTAYAAYLNCELVKDYSLSSNRDTVTVSGKDRGCSFKQSFGVSDTQEIYFKTTAQLDCSSQAFYSRLVFTAAKYSSSAPENLDNISVISCATGYRQVAGTLRVSPSADSPIIHSFTETGEPDTSRLPLWRIFEQNILGPVSFNPQAKWSTSDMGSLILYYAQRSNPSKALTSEVLMDAINNVFTAIYLNAIAIHGFKLVEEPEETAGTAFVPTTRLFVVPWVAYIIIAFLFITLCSVLFVFFHLPNCPSILSEEPQGLLSVAGILDRSDLLRIASDIRQETEFTGGTRDTGKKRPDVKDRRWTAARDFQSGNWFIKPLPGVDMGAAERLLR
ncbi:hypothetical protein ACJ41O_006625 [Fusarium nematophilum]